jgi:hypothetical protein
VTETKIQKANQNQCGSVCHAVIGSNSRPSCCKYKDPTSDDLAIMERQEQHYVYNLMNGATEFSVLASNQMNTEHQSSTVQLYCVFSYYKTHKI